MGNNKIPKAPTKLLDVGIATWQLKIKRFLSICIEIMAFARLIYSSRKSDWVEVPDLLRLLDKATENNKRNGITGLLCFTHDRFLQVLEGDASSINQLYSKIIVDKRHTEVILVDYSSCLKREFPDWAMGFVDLDTLSTKKLEINVPLNVLSEALDPVGALQLLKELGKTLHR